MRWPHYVMICIMLSAFGLNIVSTVSNPKTSSERATVNVFGYALYWTLFALVLDAGGFWP